MSSIISDALFIPRTKLVVYAANAVHGVFLFLFSMTYFEKNSLMSYLAPPLFWIPIILIVAAWIVIDVKAHQRVMRKMFYGLFALPMVALPTYLIITRGLREGLLLALAVIPVYLGIMYLLPVLGIALLSMLINLM